MIYNNIITKPLIIYIRIYKKLLSKISQKDKNGSLNKDTKMLNIL